MGYSHESSNTDIISSPHKEQNGSHSSGREVDTETDSTASQWRPKLWDQTVSQWRPNYIGDWFNGLSVKTMLWDHFKLIGLTTENQTMRLNSMVLRCRPIYKNFFMDSRCRPKCETNFSGLTHGDCSIGQRSWWRLNYEINLIYK